MEVDVWVRSQEPANVTQSSVHRAEVVADLLAAGDGAVLQHFEDVEEMQWRIAFLFADQARAPALEDAHFGERPRQRTGRTRARQQMNCRRVAHEQPSLRPGFPKELQLAPPPWRERSQNRIPVRGERPEEPAASSLGHAGRGASTRRFERTSSMQAIANRALRSGVRSG